MAADRSRLAAALAYRQAEEERRRRMMESVPVPGAELPTSVPSQNLRRDLENLSIGIGEGLTNQLEGVKGIVTDPIGAARGAYEGVKAVVRDPSIIADALRYTAQKVGSGPLGAGEVIGEMIGPRKGGPVMQELDVYHGTPHRFPATEANPLGEFDASKIGTGEGAQAYGHGIYYAESPDVARSYATMNQASAPSHASFIRLRDQSPQGSAEWKHYDNLAKEGLGSLYKADLPDEMIDRMLDWDKPLSKDAPQAVKDAFNKLAQTYPDLKEKLFAAYREGKPGSHYYSLLNDYAKTGDLVKNQSFASDAMRQAGIPGIKYLDAGSRGQGGSGTRNFVVFPGEEKKVRILERDGKKVADMLQRAAPTSAQVEVDIYPLRSDPNTLYLSKIAVPKDQQGQGLGSQAMQEIIDKADAEGKRVVLSPSTEYGASSVGRLKDFYKRFGFVENKGRNKNYAISESMYRDPKKSK